MGEIYDKSPFKIIKCNKQKSIVSISCTKATENVILIFTPLKRIREYICNKTSKKQYPKQLFKTVTENTCSKNVQN